MDGDGTPETSTPETGTTARGAEAGGPLPDPGGLCRALRRRADASQREMAALTGLSRSTIARIESGRLVPSLAVLGRLLDSAGCTLVAVDGRGAIVVPMADLPGDPVRDGGGKRFPAHLDTIPDPRGEEWWGTAYGLARPPESAHRSRIRRDVARRRSQWETRVKQYRDDPPPPTVEYLAHLRERIGADPERPDLPRGWTSGREAPCPR